MIAIVGVGNLLRGDDAIGPWVTQMVANALTDRRVRISTTSCEPLCLLESMENVDSAVIIDAAFGENPGKVEWLRPETILSQRSVVQPQVVSLVGGGRGLQALDPTSSHGFGLIQALALGCTLGALPPRLWVVAVSGSSFEIGEPMSRPVRLGGIQAAWQVVREVSRWLNE